MCSKSLTPFLLYISESDKKKKKQLKRIQLQSRIPSLISSQTSLPSSRKSGRLSGKGKKREGASENNAIEIEDSSSSSSDDESVDSDSTEAVGEVRLGHNLLYF